MRILAIETSCDETAIALLEGTISSHHTFLRPEFNVLASALHSQADLHAEYGGVYPTLAQREHVRNIVPLLSSVFHQSLSTKSSHAQSPQGSSSILYPYSSVEKKEIVSTWLSHESPLIEPLIQISSEYDPSLIDAIAVTRGPGLEPALWVGVNTARSLALLWDKPLYGINHMEGHIVSAFSSETDMKLPLLSLLVSGGHTELVVSTAPGTYSVIGSTRDDAVGEAFDKGARLLGLPYPGGRALSDCALKHREQFPEWKPVHSFPRPMISSPDFDFSFSGLKTALLYRLKNISFTPETAPPGLIDELAREYEDAIVDVLIAKLSKAIDSINPSEIIIAGGVSANTLLRNRAQEYCTSYRIPLHLPPLSLTGDNAVMIGMASCADWHKQFTTYDELISVRARGTLPLSGDV